MELTVNKDNNIQITKVFNPIELVTESGESLLIQMRDSGFEIMYEGQLLSMKQSKVYRGLHLNKDSII